mgnify:CR=1 FL=1
MSLYLSSSPTFIELYWILSFEFISLQFCYSFLDSMLCACNYVSAIVSESLYCYDCDSQHVSILLISGFEEWRCPNQFLAFNMISVIYIALAYLKNLLWGKNWDLNLSNIVGLHCILMHFFDFFSKVETHYKGSINNPRLHGSVYRRMP